MQRGRVVNILKDDNMNGKTRTEIVKIKIFDFRRRWTRTTFKARVQGIDRARALYARYDLEG